MTRSMAVPAVSPGSMGILPMKQSRTGRPCYGPLSEPTGPAPPPDFTAKMTVPHRPSRLVTIQTSNGLGIGGEVGPRLLILCGRAEDPRPTFLENSLASSPGGEDLIEGLAELAVGHLLKHVNILTEYSAPLKRCGKRLM